MQIKNKWVLKNGETILTGIIILSLTSLFISAVAIPIDPVFILLSFISVWILLIAGVLLYMIEWEGWSIN